MIKVYCNYSKKDWSRFFLYYGLLFFLISIPTVLYIENIMLPIFKENEIWIDKFIESKILEDYAKDSWVRENYVTVLSNGTMVIDQDNFDKNNFIQKFSAQLLLAMILIFGGFVLPALGVVVIIHYAFILFSWVLFKVKLQPRMKLIIKRIK